MGYVIKSNAAHIKMPPGAIAPSSPPLNTSLVIVIVDVTLLLVISAHTYMAIQ